MPLANCKHVTTQIIINYSILDHLKLFCVRYKARKSLKCACQMYTLRCYNVTADCVGMVYTNKTYKNLQQWSSTPKKLI